MSLPDVFRHQMDVVKLFLNTKLQQTIDRIPGQTLLSSLTQSNKHNNDSHDNIVDEQFSLLSHFESLLVELQALLVWDNPANSAFALTFFTIFYWVLAWLHPSLLTCTAMIGFCYHSYEMWIRYIWPAIRVPELANEESERWTKMNMNTLTAPEIEHYIERTKLAFMSAIQRLSAFRAESHGKFCGLSVSVFTILYFVTKNIPGVLLIYGIAITIFLTPGVLLHLLPKEYLETILDYCLNESSSTTNPSSTSSSSSEKKDNADESAQSNISASNESEPSAQKDTGKAAKSSQRSPSSQESIVPSSEQSTEQVPAAHLPLDISPEVEQALFNVPVSLSPIHYSPLSEQAFDVSMEASPETATSSNESTNQTHSSPLDAPIFENDDNDDNDEDDDGGEGEEEDCLVKSNYCENFFTLDRQKDNAPVQASAPFNCEQDEDTLGEDYEIISDSELEVLTSKRHF